ncbi:O-antigen ligase family protein [Acidicapsa acidisoli]|uniref:O-antigen ligase family protein n=1 Tax=Acidicapsa acidisoli TaxID=1615681 RepID=UPI0021DFA816|nr:O-antigen ligase family protein [Acidicapsa acidisoli]
MSAILLLPGIISLFLVIRGRLETAFLSVYLPSLLLLPEKYNFRLPHLPPFSAAEYALMPVGIAALLRFVKSGSFRLMDTLVVLFSISLSISEIMHEPIIADGIFAAISSVVYFILAYMTGRMLIEPDFRLAVVRRIVILMLLPGPIAVYQWMNRNIYGIIGNRILKLPMDEFVDMRAGHGKAGGSFMASEIDGIALGITFALNAWLVFLYKRKLVGNLGKLFSKLEKFHVPALLLVFYLFLTQERGPLMALVVALLILQIPKFRKPKLITGFVAVTLIVGALGAKQYFTKYTNISDDQYDSVSEQARSALYRRRMNERMQSVAEMGGWTGWGGNGVPEVEGVGKSIDNEFLRVHLIQGRLGYILFVLICAESIRTAVAQLWRFQALEDRAFAGSVLAALACLWITLYTVYMGEQLPQFAFLLIGWGQSIMPRRTSTAPVAAFESQPKFVFRQVFE